MPTDPTGRTPLLRLPGMRRANAPSLGRTNQQVRRNVPRLRRLLTPKISRGRQPTEAIMIIEGSMQFALGSRGTNAGQPRAIMQMKPRLCVTPAPKNLNC